MLNKRSKINMSCSNALIIMLLIVSPFKTMMAQQNDLLSSVEKTMLKATTYMVDTISVNGGYVRLYLPDLSSRWGELEFYRTQVQVQSPGITSMGNVFLDAYQATENEYYYEAAIKAAQSLIFGQLPCGGWNYIIDYAGDRSLKEWYRTIGRNAWGFEEFYHYYGNATFDDVTTSDAAKFLLRTYLEKFDVSLKPALDKAIGFILEAQYPMGGWPQRYPLMYNFPHGKKTDYTSFATFNDNAIWGNIEFLILCYSTLGEERLLDPILRGMNFYLITQQGNPQGGWGQQYNHLFQPDHARSYEPASLCTGQTYDHVIRLLQFYQLTGDRKYLSRIPDAIQWLESTRLSSGMTNNGTRTHPYFVEIGSNRPLWAHRVGTSVGDQHYWVDYDTTKAYAYGYNTVLNIDFLKEEYDRVSSLSTEQATKNSPLLMQSYQGKGLPQKYFEVKSISLQEAPSISEINKIIDSLDDQGRWLSKHEWISRPYSVSETGMESNTALLGTERGFGIRDSSDQLYLSTRVYENNMKVLIKYITQRQN